jgi:hypothetical protein
MYTSMIAAAIEAELNSLGLFKAVEKTVTAKTLKSPPTVAVYLASNRKEASKPTVTRNLGWDLVLVVSALGTDKGQAAAGDIVDAVSVAFTDWRPWTTGGVLPSEVDIVLEGTEGTLLIYTARVTMKVMPSMIVNQG